MDTTELGGKTGLSILSSLLFDLFVEHMRRITAGEEEGAVRLKNVLIELLGYADDLAVVNKGFSTFCHRMKAYDRSASAMGMEISIAKTKTMMCGQLAVDDSLACEICGSTDRETEMMICETADGLGGCRLAYHTCCLSEPLGSVPDGEWLCSECEGNRGKVALQGGLIDEVDGF